tara:strand:+ start:36 stop:383 length:348 start_codon:yes stop_codon:yes gene_type:complete
MDKITITNLKLNKGIDIKGKDRVGDDIYLTSGSSVNETVNLINQYCDSYQEIVATFDVHPSFVKEDKKKYLIRLMKLVERCKNLNFNCAALHNVEIDGHVFPNSFYLVLTYEKGA